MDADEWLEKKSVKIWKVIYETVGDKHTWIRNCKLVIASQKFKVS